MIFGILAFQKSKYQTAAHALTTHILSDSNEIITEIDESPEKYPLLYASSNLRIINAVYFNLFE